MDPDVHVSPCGISGGDPFLLRGALLADYKLLPVCSQFMFGLLDHFVLGGDEALWDQALCGEISPFARESCQLISLVLDELLVLVLEFCFGEADSRPRQGVATTRFCDPD